MTAPAARPSFLKYVYTHNPFYAISAVLMLYSIRTASETLGVGPGHVWLMTGVLAGYTLLLAAIGVWIVRWGKVWEDARSILLLLLLLFLAVSISADDLFVKAETSQTATSLLLCGFLFSALVSEAVLWGAGVRLGARYRVPYHLMLALFYAAPWWYSPGLHPQFEASLDWMLLLFPVVAAVLFLSLFPAVRGGSRYVAANGTPWPWPWFPGTAFAVIAAAVSLRSYALTMTFGLNGPIWKTVSSGRVIVFDTIWGPYFLVPLAAAMLILLLEAGLVSGSQRTLLRVLRNAPLLLVLGVSWDGGNVYRHFLESFVATVGAPFWLTTCLLVTFYVWAWIRGVSSAGGYALVAGALLSIVGPGTTGLDTFTDPQPWPLLVIAGILLARGLWVRSSARCTVASAVAVVGLWWLLRQTSLVEYRLAICFHFAWLAFLAIGLLYSDPFALLLRACCAAIFPVATLVALAGFGTEPIPLVWRGAYAVLLMMAALALAWTWRSLPFLYASGGTAGILLYASVVSSFHRLASVLGQSAVNAFVWSLGTLLLALLISAQKARWLPRKLFPWLSNGNTNGDMRPHGPPKPANGL